MKPAQEKIEKIDQCLRIQPLRGGNLLYITLTKTRATSPKNLLWGDPLPNKPSTQSSWLVPSHSAGVAIPAQSPSNCACVAWRFATWCCRCLDLLPFCFGIIYIWLDSLLWCQLLVPAFIVPHLCLACQVAKTVLWSVSQTAGPPV